MRTRIAPLITGSLLVATALAAPAAAATDPADAAALGLGRTAAVDDRGTSLFFAGFADTGVGSAATGATFRVPELTCGATDEGFVTTVWAITEDGEFLAGPDLFSYCADGEFVLDGHVTTSGGQIPIWQDLRPGDRVRMSITAHAQGTSTHDVAFESLTRDWVSSLPTNSPVDRIEIGIRRMSLDGVSIPPPDFGTFRFSQVVFDDVLLDGTDADRTQLVDADGAVLVNPRRASGDGRFRLISKVE